MVLRLRQHNIGYTADGFYRSDEPTNSVKALNLKISSALFRQDKLHFGMKLQFKPET